MCLISYLAYKLHMIEAAAARCLCPNTLSAVACTEYRNRCSRLLPVAAHHSAGQAPYWYVIVGTNLSLQSHSLPVLLVYSVYMLHTRRPDLLCGFVDMKPSGETFNRRWEQLCHTLAQADRIV